MVHDVFISYSDQDKAVADATCAHLENMKIRCWIAPRDVPPGSSWPASLSKAIDECLVFVIVFSSGSNNSPQVIREVERAVSKGKTIIPFRIEDVQPSDDMGYLIGSVHWLDALTPPLESHIERLADTVSVLVTGQPKPKSKTTVDSEMISKEKKWLPFAIVLFLAVAIIAGSAGLWLGSHSSSQQLPIDEKPTSLPTDSVQETQTSSGISVPLSTQAITSDNAEQLKQFKVIDNSYIKQLSWSPDGKLLITAERDVNFYDTQTFENILQIEIGLMNDMAFSPDGIILATADHDGVLIWKVDGGGELGTIPGTKTAESLAFSPDGSRLAVAIGQTAKLFDVSSKSELKTFIADNSQKVVAFSLDGKILATAGLDITLWDIASGNELHTLTRHGNWVYCVAFSPDGNIFASGGCDDNVRLWDIETGFQQRTLSGHTDSVRSVAFSPDGKLLASASSDSTIKLWDVETGRELQTFTGHTDRINSVAFSPDGSMLASGGQDYVRLWAISS